MIEILGPVTIADDTSRHTVRATKIRTLLAVLACEVQRVVSYEQLVAELWGEQPPAGARNALQANVVRLRRLLQAVGVAGGEQSIQAVGGGYLLSVPPETVDATCFLDLSGRGSDLVDSDPGRAIPLLRDALGLWRGDALADVEEGYRCRMAVSYLTERRLVAQENLATAQLRIGAERNVIPDLKRLVMQFPEREVFSELLMVALYRCGQQSEALDVFQRTWQWLDSELGLEPGLPLKNLRQKILTQDKALAGGRALSIAL